MAVVKGQLSWRPFPRALGRPDLVAGTVGRNSGAQRARTLTVLLCLPQPSSPPAPQQFVIQHSLFGSPVPKTKDPPRYEEAIKQTRSAQPSCPEVSEAGASVSCVE